MVRLLPIGRFEHPFAHGAGAWSRDDTTALLDVTGYALISAVFGAGVYIAARGNLLVGLPMALFGPTVALQGLGLVAGREPKE